MVIELCRFYLIVLPNFISHLVGLTRYSDSIYSLLIPLAAQNCTVPNVWMDISGESMRSVFSYSVYI